MSDTLVAMLESAVFAWLLLVSAIVVGGAGAYALVKSAHKVLEVMEIQWRSICRWFGL